jgi:hypothetical protein
LRDGHECHAGQAGLVQAEQAVQAEPAEIDILGLNVRHPVFRDRDSCSVQDIRIAGDELHAVLVAVDAVALNEPWDGICRTRQGVVCGCLGA